MGVMLEDITEVSAIYIGEDVAIKSGVYKYVHTKYFPVKNRVVAYVGQKRILQERKMMILYWFDV